MELLQPVKVNINEENYTTYITARQHPIIADEPLDIGGQDKGATPYELILSSLGSCTAITLRMYAQNKKWDLLGLEIELNFTQEVIDNVKKTTFYRDIIFQGNLDQLQKERLLQIAKACPIAKIISGEIEIISKEKVIV
jgi:putative redox protein